VGTEINLKKKKKERYAKSKTNLVIKHPLYLIDSADWLGC